MPLWLSPLGKTWLVDVDGTLVKHNGYKIDGRDTLLDGVEEFFRQIPKTDRVVVLTARTGGCLEELKEFLSRHRLRCDQILCNLPAGERILINDKKPGGLYTAYAVNKVRDAALEARVKIVDDRARDRENRDLSAAGRLLNEQIEALSGLRAGLETALIPALDVLEAADAVRLQGAALEGASALGAAETLSRSGIPVLRGPAASGWSGGRCATIAAARGGEAARLARSLKGRAGGLIAITDEEDGALAREADAALVTGGFFELASLALCGILLEGLAARKNAGGSDLK